MRSSAVIKFLLMASALGSISNLTHAMGQRPLDVDTALLGSVRLDRRSDEPGTVQVRQCLSDGLRLKYFLLLSDARPMRLERMELVDMNNQVSHIPVHTEVSPNSSLRVAGIPENVRCLKEIRLVGNATEGRFSNVMVGARAESDKK